MHVAYRLFYFVYVICYLIFTVRSKGTKGKIYLILEDDYHVYK